MIANLIKRVQARLRRSAGLSVESQWTAEKAPLRKVQLTRTKVLFIDLEHPFASNPKPYHYRYIV